MSARRGSAALEFAISLPVLLILVAGIVDFGWWFYREVGIIQIARDAALAGSITKLASDPMGTAQARAQAALTAAGYALGPATVQTRSVATASGTCLEVSLSAPYDHLLSLIPAPDTVQSLTCIRMLDQP